MIKYLVEVDDLKDIVLSDDKNNSWIKFKDFRRATLVEGKLLYEEEITQIVNDHKYQCKSLIKALYRRMK